MIVPCNLCGGRAASKFAICRTCKRKLKWSEKDRYGAPPPFPLIEKLPDGRSPGQAYRCWVCKLVGSLVEINAHVILVHHSLDKVLRRSLDLYPQWWFLVYSKPNPTPRPVLDMRALRKMNLGAWQEWLPFVWGVVEYKKPSHGLPRLRHVPLVAYRKYGPGSLDDVGLTIASQVERRVRLKGRELGRWIWKRLNGRSWTVIPALEVKWWIKHKRNQFSRRLMNY